MSEEDDLPRTKKEFELFMRGLEADDRVKRHEYRSAVELLPSLVQTGIERLEWEFRQSLTVPVGHLINDVVAQAEVKDLADIIYKIDMQSADYRFSETFGAQVMAMQARVADFTKDYSLNERQHAAIADIICDNALHDAVSQGMKEELLKHFPLPPCVGRCQASSPAIR